MRRPLAVLTAVSALAGLLQAQAELVTHLPEGGVTNLGWRLAFLGDVNGDGLGDYAYADIFDGSVGSSGVITVRSGAGFGLLYEVEGVHSFAKLGRGLAATGDLDGDGVPDFAAISDDTAGQAVVTGFSGVDGASLGELAHAVDGEAFSSALAGPGDVNLDGVPDIVLGLPHADTPFFNAGAVNVYHGDGGGLLRGHTGDAEADLWGQEVCALGDLDADGFMDYGGGSAQVDAGGNNRGMLRMYAGQSGAVLHEFVGQFSGDFLAIGAALGDVDGDGHDDALIASPGWGPLGNGKHGLVQAISGQTGAELWSVSGPSQSADMGRSMAGAGDLDGDGVPDALLGVPELDDFEPGHVQARSGADGALLFEFEDGFNGDSFGAAVAAGDVNGDGVDDLIVGAPSHSRVQVWSATCGAFLTYGDGCPGSAGIEPTLDLVGCATPGGSFNMNIDRSLGGATAMLVLGVGPLSAPIFGGCTLLAEPTVLVPVVLDGSGPGQGKLQIPAELPVPAPLVSLYLQVFVSDPGGAAGWASSPGVELVID